MASYKQIVQDIKDYISTENAQIERLLDSRFSSKASDRTKSGKGNPERYFKHYKGRWKMKVSELIAILSEYKEKYGDVEVTGVCNSCQTEGLEVTVLTDDENKTIQIDLEEEGWDEQDGE